MTPPEQRSWLRRWLNQWEVDQPVFFAISARGWQFVAGPITLLLIATYFTPEVQGYYYTFWSLVGLQMLFELSLPAVILTVASHEWGRLSLADDGTIAGESRSLSRLSSLTRTALVWYGTAAVLFGTIVSLAGLWFFSRAESHDIDWQGPWLALVVLTSVAFWLTPLVTILEGCNQVREVYIFQFVRAVLGNLVVWCCIPLGAGLWVPAISSLVRLVCELMLLAGRYGTFFRQLFRKPSDETILWMTEVWPFQWRTGLKSICVYVNGYLVNPIIFHYHGAVPAGQIGFTWQVITSLQAACSSWVKTRAARLGMLVARREFAELDRVFFRVATIACGMLCLSGSLLWLGVLMLEQVWPALASRMADPLSTGLLSAAFALALVSECQWIYIHAHRQSPFLVATLAASLINAVLYWVCGSLYGVTGIALSLLAVNLLLTLPISLFAFRYIRNEWRQGLSSISGFDTPQDGSRFR